MTEKIVNFFIKTFGKVDKNIIIFIISLMPILELRGGLIAATLLKLEFIPSFIICLIGNIIPVPFILLFITKIFELLKKFNWSKKIINKIEASSLKRKGNIEKYKYWGLFLFVGIPLPGTGAWTGSLLAVLLGLNRKKSFWIIMLGVLLAGIIMSILSFGILGNLI